MPAWLDTRKNAEFLANMGFYIGAVVNIGNDCARKKGVQYERLLAPPLLLLHSCAAECSKGPGFQNPATSGT